MNTNVILTLIGMAIASIISLVVAYLHRKQMRQVEAFRIDRSVGLLPPPHPIVSFTKKRLALLTVCGGSLIVLVIEGTRNAPITRSSVFTIALGVAGFLAGVFLDLLQRIVTLIATMSSTIKSILQSHENLLEGIQPATQNSVVASEVSEAHSTDT